MQRNGSETLSTADTSPQATLTSDQSLTLAPTISKDMPRPISSPESEDGPSPSDLPDGTTTDLFGQAHVPASLSAPPARARRPMTDATCGLRGFLSSRSGALQQSLESRLKRRLDGAGSTLFALIWKAKGTPAGRPYCQLAASARLISETDFGSWPTPVANDDNKTPEAHLAMKKRMGERDGSGSNRRAITSFQVMAQTVGGWPTPMAGTPAQKGYNEAGNTDSGRKTVALSAWPTPRVSGEESLESYNKRKETEYQKYPGKGIGSGSMEVVAQRANWATPTARDYRSESATDNFNVKRWGHTRGKPLSAEATLAVSGPTPNGSTAPMEKPGQLDPDHSRWVMGYSAEHLSCAPTETLSFLKSRRNLSVQP